jgi:hypothetical protein
MPSSPSFRRQVVFRIDAEEWPLLETLVREHGSMQAGILAALRGAVAGRLQAQAGLSAADDGEQGGRKETAGEAAQPAPAGGGQARGARPRPAAGRSQTLRPSAPALSPAGPPPGFVELNLAEAAPILDTSATALRTAIKARRLPGRRNELGFYLAFLKPEALRESGAELSARGGAEVLGLKKGTIVRHCRQGRYPHAHNEGYGWLIPARELLPGS